MSATLTPTERVGSSRATPATPESMASQQTRADFCSATSLSTPDLIRAVKLSCVMRRMGSVLVDSAGTPDAFARESFTINPPLLLNDFLSHNWSTGRWEKFFALAMFYNLNAATVAVYSSGFLVSLLVAWGLLPLIDVSPIINKSGNLSVHCQVLGSVAFLLALCHASSFKAAMGFRERSVFLDKLCINQADDELKKEAIAGLAAFLKCSEKLVIVYQSEYLKRLWTVYEVASFLALHRDTSRIAFCPTFAPKAILCCFFMVFVTNLMINLYGTISPTDTTLHMILSSILFPSKNWLFLLTWAAAVRSWLRYCHGMRAAISEFEVRKARCSVEADRTLVHTNIVIFMKAIGEVQEDAGEEEALDAFNAMVKAELPHAIVALWVRVLNFQTVATATAPIFLVHLDHAAARLEAGLAWTSVATTFMEGLIFNLGLCPCSGWLMLRFLSSQLHLSGMAELRYTLRPSLLIVLPLTSLLYMPLATARRLETYDLTLAACMVNACYMCLLPPVAAWLWWGTNARQQAPAHDSARIHSHSHRQHSKEVLGETSSHEVSAEVNAPKTQLPAAELRFVIHDDDDESVFSL